MLKTIYSAIFINVTAFVFAPLAWSKVFHSGLPLKRGFSQILHVSKDNLSDFSVDNTNSQREIQTLCQSVRQKFKSYGWHEEPCAAVKWQADLKTAKGHPLIYTSFGAGSEVTLFLGGVHPDELTPIPLSFQFARYLDEHPELYKGRGVRIIVAPLVNPDGFLQARPIRTNGRVDVNRNFFTLDWYERARLEWRKKPNPARLNPGFFPNTEPETIFQIQLIDNFEPDKIFSVHAPLGFYDYDGPGDQNPIYITQNDHKARQYVVEVAKKSSNYRIVDYEFYPGSLGNFAGNERHLPTVTLELETTKPELVQSYWEKFLPGFIHSFQYPYKRKVSLLKVQPNAAKFFKDVYSDVATKDAKF